MIDEVSARRALQEAIDAIEIDTDDEYLQGYTSGYAEGLERALHIIELYSD